VAEYNQLDQVEALFKRYGDDIACIILEPVAGNMNLVMPKPGFLQGLRELCDHYGALLIFDEVITGFRVAKGGAQAHFQVTPDLTILGKIIGGGFPAAAFGGRADIMQKLAPLGPVYQAGTLSGNPIAMTAGLATLELVSQPDFYSDLEKKTQTIAEGLSQRAEKAGIPFFTQSIGAMLGMYFTNNRTIEKESDIKACDIDAFTLFFRAMLNEGVYFAPSAFEIAFVSAAHGQPEIEKTLTAAEKVFKEMGA